MGAQVDAQFLLEPGEIGADLHAAQGCGRQVTELVFEVGVDDAAFGSFDQLDQAAS